MVERYTVAINISIKRKSRLLGTPVPHVYPGTIVVNNSGKFGVIW